MRKIETSELLDIAAYERVRSALRQAVMGYKENRRLKLGEKMSMVFENHLTMRFQMQEMMRAERMVQDEQIREELAVWNELVPGDSELSATLFIEITDRARIREEIERMLGLERCVSLEVGGNRVAGEFESDRSTDTRISAVQYVRFRLPEEARRAFLETDVPAQIRVEHPHYAVAVPIPPAVRASLADDLRGVVPQA